MKKNGLLWRFLWAFLSFLMMFGVLSLFNILFLYKTDLSSYFMAWSIAWAIGYFIAATLRFHQKSRLFLAVIDSILILSTLALACCLFASGILSFSTDFIKRQAIIAVVSFLISLVLNNYDFEKYLDS